MFDLRQDTGATIGLALMIGLITSCGPKPSPHQAKHTTAETMVVRLAQADDVKPVAATFTTYKMAEASARISGILTRLTVHEGDDVRQGQVIGAVSDPKIGLQTGAFSAQAVAAEAQAVQARSDYKRIHTLFDQGIYAQARLDQAKAVADASEANLRAARAQTAANSALGAEGAILAPSSGRVIKADIPAGTVVMPGQSIATITSGDRVVRIELPEAQAGSLHMGDKVGLVADTQSASGTITRLYPAVSQGQIMADVTPNGLTALPVGAHITVLISLGKRMAMVVPRRFVVARFGLDYVRLVQGDGSNFETTVQTSPTQKPDQVEIVSGLNAGDRIASFVGRP